MDDTQNNNINNGNGGLTDNQQKPASEINITQIIAALSRTFVTRPEAEEIAKQAVPRELRNLGKSPPLGTFLRCTEGNGSNLPEAFWGPSV